MDIGFPVVKCTSAHSSGVTFSTVFLYSAVLTISQSALDVKPEACASESLIALIKVFFFFF